MRIRCAGDWNFVSGAKRYLPWYLTQMEDAGEDPYGSTDEDLNLIESSGGPHWHIHLERLQQLQAALPPRCKLVNTGQRVRSRRPELAHPPTPASRHIVSPNRLATLASL
jgi:hypothetical protein